MHNGASAADIFGDQIMLLAIGLSAIASVILGFQFVDAGLSIGATAALLVLAGLAYSGAKGTVVSRVVLTFVLVSLVALHIQLARGMDEFHFGVFVTLALLLVIGMARAAKEGEELGELVKGVNRTDGIALDVSSVSTLTVAGQALKSTLERMDVAVAEVRARGLPTSRLHVPRLPVAIKT